MVDGTSARLRPAAVEVRQVMAASVGRRVSQSVAMECERHAKRTARRRKQLFHRVRPHLARRTQPIKNRRHFGTHPHLAPAEQPAGPVDKLQVTAQREPFEQIHPLAAAGTLVVDRAEPVVGVEPGRLCRRGNATQPRGLKVLQTPFLPAMLYSPPHRGMGRMT